MFNEAQVFLAGYVAREPKFRLTTTGVSMASLRVAFTPRRVDRDTGEWTDGATSFVTVICWRGLADNVATCLRKGEPVLVKGRLQVRPYDKDGVSRLAVEIEASSIGHDLARGVANFQRARRSPGETALGRAGAAAALNGQPAGGELPADAAMRGDQPPDGEFFAADAMAGLANGDLPGAGPEDALGGGQGAGESGEAEPASVAAPF